MSTTEYVIRKFNEHDIRERQTDRYYDATAMCRANGKKWNDYFRLKSTSDFVDALASDAGIPASLLIVSHKGVTSDGREQGTFVHPKLAMNLAQWCSPKFAVVVSGWVLDILTTGKAEVVPVGDPLIANMEAMIALRKTQLEHERKLATVEAKADRALQQATAARQTSESNYGWYSVLAFCKRVGRTLSVTESAKVGKELADKLRSIGGQPQRVSDPRFGFVNLYPESLLAEHFGCCELVY